eukprot:CAMPEP_0175099528 /NCGR_PEP_ID=MMETSP0086_2-20121207/6510_1 /TAXON_ID=136419 /ORGANISM="Unknown Unknown, Strain D1" /LENGTH=187 /DNA_ID=CAMNT_0016373395 /DNA_START=42 /DNA_END=605 /DNA_ORIENTATION=-
MTAESNQQNSTVLEKTVAVFKNKPPPSKLHPAALQKYQVFCRNRTVDLYTTFFALVGEQDVSWCDVASYNPSFKASVPFPGKKNERIVSGGSNNAKQIHGLCRYEYQCCLIEECRKNGLVHGLRVVCTQMGDVWVRLHKDGKRLAQVVLSADLCVQPSMSKNEGGLKMLLQHIHLVQDCFVDKSDET